MSGWSSFDGASTLSSATSVEGSLPTTCALTGCEVSVLPSVTSILLGAVDDMRVGEDVAGVVDHEARAGRGPPAATPEGVERRGGLRRLLGLDERDSGGVLLVDLVDGEPLARWPPVAAGCGSGVAASVVASLLLSDDFTQPALIAIKPTMATTSPPARAAPKEVLTNRPSAPITLLMDGSFGDRA